MFDNESNSIDTRPSWGVLESTPLRELAGEDVGGDIHTTVDLNPDSPTFGDAHWTMRLPGGTSIHGS